MNVSSRSNRNENAGGAHVKIRFELFVQAGFSELELASVTETLQIANGFGSVKRFGWSFVSDQPGLVKGSAGMLVQAEPAIPDHGLADWMVVIGFTRLQPEAWLKRLRSMQRNNLGVALLSSAATAYIRHTKVTRGNVTTHWRDFHVLSETGDYPQLTSRLSEESGGVVTAAGVASTPELIVALIAEFLSPLEVAELGNHLLVQTIRKSRTEQPKDISDNQSLFADKVSQAIRLMENSIDEPLSVSELAQSLKLSVRQLERQFQSSLKTSPSRFYKQLRLKRARLLLDQTQMSLAEITVATGFSSTNILSKAFREEYGESPMKSRTRTEIQLLDYQVHSAPKTT